MAKSAAPNSSKKDKPAARQRSPHYPSVGLPDAVAKAERLYEGVGTAGASPESAAKLIGYSKNHGTARMTVSALKKFGLLEDRNGRLVPSRLTLELANFAPTHPRHSAALRAAALSPTAYRDVYTRYRPHGVLPPDDVLAPELVTDAGFLPDKVGGFLSDFRASLVHAGLLRGNSLEEVGDPAAGAGGGAGGPALDAFSDHEAPKTPGVGDTVRWTEGGGDEDGDEEPDAHEGVVQGLSDDGKWAFIAGYGEGVPVADLELVPPEPAAADAEEAPGDAPPAPAAAPANPFAAPAPAARTEAFGLEVGDVILARPDELSAESLDELQDWLDLVMKKLRRRAAEA